VAGKLADGRVGVIAVAAAAGARLVNADRRRVEVGDGEAARGVALLLSEGKGGGG
jgi:hypothetical protein